MVNFYTKISLVIIYIFLFTPKTWCMEENFIFLTFQQGIQDTTQTAQGISNKGTYLSSLEERNGALNENSKVNTRIFSFDFYKIIGNFASGFGIEFHNYKKKYTFENNSSSVNLDAVGLLYGLNFYYRGDYWFPFVGIGSGNYSAKIKEHLKAESSETRATVFGQVDKPFYYKFGLRIPLNGFGIVLTKKFISANIQVDTENKNLSLGGVGTFLGIYFSL